MEELRQEEEDLVTEELHPTEENLVTEELGPEELTQGEQAIEEQHNCDHRLLMKMEEYNCDQLLMEERKRRNEAVVHFDGHEKLKLHGDHLPKVPPSLLSSD